MNGEQKQYIEQNIDLIENKDWDEFFQNAPDSTGTILYAAGIDFMSEMKKVPRKCFKESDIKSVTIPNSVTSIGWSAFYRCSGLTSVTFGENIQLTSIGYYAFAYCNSLTSITIPDSVTSIGDNAFFRCSNLMSVNFNGTKAQWDKITFGNNWKSNSSITQIVCTDGIIDII